MAAPQALSGDTRVSGKGNEAEGFDPDEGPHPEEGHAEPALEVAQPTEKASHDRLVLRQAVKLTGTGKSKPNSRFNFS
jgi:hypothetical protein